MGSRLELHDEFQEELGSSNVYFQPPASVLMKYPAIRYNGSGYSVDHANNRIYRSMKRYEGVVITQDPDSDIVERLMRRFQYISVGNQYVADNLYHFPFTLYY